MENLNYVSISFLGSFVIATMKSKLLCQGFYWAWMLERDKYQHCWQEWTYVLRKWVCEDLYSQSWDEQTFLILVSFHVFCFCPWVWFSGFRCWFCWFVCIVFKSFTVLCAIGIQRTLLIHEMYNDDLLMLQIMLGNVYVLMGKGSEQGSGA